MLKITKVENDQIDAEFQELFDQLSCETDIYKYINFDIEVVASLQAISQLMVDLRQETRNKSIAEVMETSNAAAQEANQSKEEPEIVIDENESRNITAAGTSKKLVKVKNLIEVNGNDHLNMIVNELIENVEQVNLKNQKQKDMRS